MSLLKELIIRGVLVVAINDAVILYVVTKRGIPVKAPLVAGMILVTCIALVINIWYCLHKNGII